MGQQNTDSPPLQSSRKLVEARDTVRGALRRLLSAISRYPHHYGSSRGSERIYFTTNYTNLHEYVPRGARNGKEKTTTKTTWDNNGQQNTDSPPLRSSRKLVVARDTVRGVLRRLLSAISFQQKTARYVFAQFNALKVFKDLRAKGANNITFIVVLQPCG